MKRLWLPSKANNYRPWLLHLRGLFVLAFFLLAVFLYYPKLLVLVAQPSVLGSQTQTLEASRIIDLTNQIRLNQGLKPLKENYLLNQAAYIKAKDMLARNYWAHTTPDGQKPWFFLDEVGYDYAAAGENLAKNFSLSTKLVEAWYRSPLHRKNLLNPVYTQIGVAVVQGKLNGVTTNLVVQFMAKPNDQAFKLAIKSQSLTKTVLANQTVAKPQQLVQKPTEITQPSRFKKTLTSLILILLLVAVALDVYYVERLIPKRYHSYSRLHFVFIVFLLILVILVHPSGIIK